MATEAQLRRWRNAWDKGSKSYDKQMRFMDRVVFGDSRAWVCSRAEGEVLEVAVGTALNLEHYPADVQLTGIDISADMLAIGRDRTAELDRPATLLEGDAHRLPFADASFDTVVCTFGLCAIPDPEVALREMDRVLRPGGLLLLADHVVSTSRVARGVQRLLEVATVPLAGEHFRRRPLPIVESLGYRLEAVQRFKIGLVERLAARKPEG